MTKTRTASIAEAWPRLMRAETAARYLDETSVEAFRRGVGTIYPRPRKVARKGDRWLKDDLDQAIDRLTGPSETELARVSLASVSARGIDKLYAALQTGTRVERRLRQANLCMIRMARAWDAVKRLNPEVVPDPNPFRGVELEHGKATAPA